jgi:hypothetical protein
MQVFRSRRSVERSLLTLGIGLVLAAIVGGGLEVAGFQVPLVSSVVRQILLAVLGIAVASLSLFVRSDEATEQPVEEKARQVARTRRRGLVAAMPSEVVIDQPTEVWVQVCLPNSSGFVASLPQYTSSGEEIGKSDARSSPGSVQFTEREGRLLDTVLSVALTSPDFRVVNETRKINVSPHHDSAKLVFQVVPTKVVIRGRVFVSVSQQLDGAHITVAEVSVTAGVKPSDEVVPVPASASVLWNVSQLDVEPLAHGATFDISRPSGTNVGGSVTKPIPVEASAPVEARRAEEAKRMHRANESLKESRPGWAVVAVAAVSVGVVGIVIWKLLG